MLALTGSLLFLRLCNYASNLCAANSLQASAIWADLLASFTVYRTL